MRRAFKKRTGSRRIAGLVVSLVLLPAVSYADIVIELQNSFIDFAKDRATLSVKFTIDKAHPKPNRPEKDGDLHVVGRTTKAPGKTDVGLPMVVEIMNAKDAPKAVALAQASGTVVDATGVWRLWCEHGGDAIFKQGAPVPRAKSTNPDHVFELHPLVHFGSEDLTPTLGPIDGFKYKDAAKAFAAYSAIPSTITPGKKTTKIRTRMAGFNYVEFWAEVLDDEPHKLVDGGLATFAMIQDQDGDVLVGKRRIIFVQGTAAWNAAKAAKQGDRLHLVAVPRISLSMVAWRVAHAKEEPDVLTWSLPYELVAAATLK